MEGLIAADRPIVANNEVAGYRIRGGTLRPGRGRCGRSCQSSLDVGHFTQSQAGGWGMMACRLPHESRQPDSLLGGSPPEGSATWSNSCALAGRSADFNLASVHVMG